MYHFLTKLFSLSNEHAYRFYLIDRSSITTTSELTRDTPVTDISELSQKASDSSSYETCRKPVGLSTVTPPYKTNRPPVYGGLRLTCGLSLWLNIQTNSCLTHTPGTVLCRLFFW